MNVLEFPPGLNPEYPVNRLYLGELMKQATRKLVELKAWAADRGIPVHTRIATGIPSEEVLAVAEAEDTDLIVVGTRGKTGLAHVVLGSTAERIIRTAPCPVLAVRTEGGGTERTGSGRRHPAPLDRILVPIDFSDCSLDALEYAVVVAQRAKASLLLLHVLEPVLYGLDFTLPQLTKREQTKEAATERLADVVSALTAVQVPSEHLIRGGNPGDSILDVARTKPADMIIMGTHGRRGLSHAFYGSVAEFVLRKSPCPVLTVRSPKFHPGHRRVLSAQPSMPTNS
jgi:nucleotide-binding universal stress UspA family protein